MKISFYEWCVKNKKESLLSEWDFEKNENLNTKELGYGSNKNVWWTGNECNHQWIASIKNRTRGTGCPICFKEGGRKLVKRRTLIKGENDLATEHPELLREWDFRKNGDLLPSDCLSGSHKKVWWVCPRCNQSYQSSISDRVRGRECSRDICKKKKQADNIKKALLKRRGSLLKHNPDLAKEWHPTKNSEITPDDISPRSDVKVWWIGKCGHEWEATPSNRVRMNSGCPICANKIILVGFNDLATTHKELCSEWDYVKNRDVLPTEVVAGTHRQVWWLCNKGHSFKASISNRSKNNRTGCPHCDIERKASFNEKVIYFYLRILFKDIQENYRPEFLNKKELDIFIPRLSLAIEYDGEYYHKKVSRDISKNKICRKNGIEVIRIREPRCPNLPAEFTYYNRKTLNENELKDCIDFILNYINVNYNLNLKLDIDLIRDRSKVLEMYLISEKENSLEFINPELAIEWHPTKNGRLVPSNISYSSNKSVWWLGSCGHEWEAKVNNRLNGNGCPICYESTGRKIVHRRSLNKGVNDLETENPELAKEWHPTKNGDYKPMDFLSGSSKKVWWLGKCGHEWQSQINSRQKGTGCTYCSGHKVLKGFNDLVTKNPQLAKEWHPTKNKQVKPSEVIASSDKLVWWLGDCGHEWEAKIRLRLNGSNCPICYESTGKKITRRRILVKGVNDLETVDLILAKEWHPIKNGDLVPSDFLTGSKKRVWWVCENGHEWEAVINKRFNGNKCPRCQREKKH